MGRRATKDLMTVTLTPNEQRLLEVLRKPEAATMSTVDICKAAGLNESTYYRAFKRPDFVKAVQAECLSLYQAAMLPVTHRTIQSALTDKSHHWARMVQEMTGLYTPNREANVKTPVQVIFNFGRPDSDNKVIDVTPVNS